jgi:3-dehydroquinate dehydratase II
VRILVVSGPNLDRLGVREPDVYGRETLADIERAVRARAAEHGVDVDFFQSNAEGRLIDHLAREGADADGIVINPGALTHYSYSLHDCLKALTAPIVEVHLSNLYARPEGFRSRSVTAPATRGVISGLGSAGYVLALDYLVGSLD